MSSLNVVQQSEPAWLFPKYDTVHSALAQEIVWHMTHLPDDLWTRLASFSVSAVRTGMIYSKQLHSAFCSGMGSRLTTFLLPRLRFGHQHSCLSDDAKSNQKQNITLWMAYQYVDSCRNGNSAMQQLSLTVWHQLLFAEKKDQRFARIHNYIGPLITYGLRVNLPISHHTMHIILTKRGSTVKMRINSKK